MSAIWLNLKQVLKILKKSNFDWSQPKLNKHVYVSETGLGSITNWQLQLLYQLQAKHNYQLQL